MMHMYYARYKSGFLSYWKIRKKRRWWFDKVVFKCYTENNHINEDFEKIVKPELERLKKEELENEKM